MSGKSRRATRSIVLQRKALALAIGGSIALGISGGAFAQATTGTIHGTVPVAPNETIQVTGGAGFNRTISVGPTGQYSITLPVGTYTVTLLQNGKAIQSQSGVTPAASGAVEVNFSTTAAPAPALQLGTIQVTANAIPAIDVTSTNQVTTITAKDLERLPLRRSAEDIALLAPSTTPGATLLGTGPLNTDFLVFGGASVAENAYYMDGMNTTDQLTGQGGITLPYGAIEQQQTFTSGYGAKYGRSIGGVINQIGKSGSNEWHFGFRGSWQPSSWRSDPKNQYWNNPRSTIAGQQQGDLRTWNKGESRMETIYDAYVGGPIVPDKLFFFVSAEQDNVGVSDITSKSSPFNHRYTQHYPKLYAKLNWNINASNFLTLTGVQNSFKQWEDVYDFDYSNFTTGDFSSLGQTRKNTFRVWVANYTSYITDNLTLNAMFGKMHGRYFTDQPAFPGFDPTLPHIRFASSQNPALVPPGGIVNSNTSTTMTSPGHYDRITNYRLSLDYKWRNHDFTIGIDNLNTADFDDGRVTTGPGYAWEYGHGDPGTPIVGDNPSSPPYAGPPNSNPDGATGYYVAKYVFVTAASVRVKQRAQYIQDNWQLTPNFLLNLGIRNDQFVNYNPASQPYIRLTKPQWQPRIGFSWDVHGDASMKVFGNAGRYYLALPAGVALRGAGASLYTREYYTYSGVDANGIPTGLTLLPQNPSGGVSANFEYGQPADPKTVASTNIEAEYSDNFVLGMQMKLDPEWVFGATGTLERLGGNIVDDWDDMDALCEAAIAQGVSFPGDASIGLTPVAQCTGLTKGIVLINPVKNQTVLINGADGKLHKVHITPADQMFDGPVKRKYYGLTLSLTHPFDGKWFGKIMYTFSKNYGNTEGPVLSDIGQGGSSVSITEQWDYWQLMNYSNGEQLNSQRHQLKAYGFYQITPEWRVGGNLFIASGHPAYCLGAFGPDEGDPLGYGNAYHWCGGQPAPPGSTGRTPWLRELSLNVNYSPAWLDHRFNISLAVLNALNEQTPTQYSPSYGTTDTPSTSYRLVQGWTPPRTFRLTMSYDW